MILHMFYILQQVYVTFERRKSTFVLLQTVAPPNIVIRGGQVGPLKILVRHPNQKLNFINSVMML